MGYVIAGLLVLLVIAIGVTLLVVSSRRAGREQQRAAADPDFGSGLPGSDMAIVAREPDVPLGDTAEHAGEQREGETVDAPDATPGPAPPTSGGHAAPPVDGGEGEGRRRV
jgi:hypothetical protein